MREQVAVSEIGQVEISDVNDFGLPSTPVNKTIVFIAAQADDG